MQAVVVRHRQESLIEIEALASLRARESDYVMKLYASSSLSYDDDASRYCVALCAEYLPPIKDSVDCYAWTGADWSSFVMCILRGLREVHAAGFVHRDVKVSDL